MPIDEVRGQVRALLERSPAFLAMSHPERREFASSMVRVASALADQPAAGGQSGQGGQGGEKSDPVDDLKGRLAQKQKLVGDEFHAGATREGVEQFGELVKKVDFPAFVSGLVNGVFKAVVDASMEQMRAYGELLSACAKSVDEFARDNITDAMARDNVKSRFPSSVSVATDANGGSRLKLLPDADGTDLAKAYGVSNVDLDDPDSEMKLLASAKLELGRQRQQLLTTMVLLGINRIVVTDGRINAKVVFDMRADDTAKRRAKAQMDDEQKSASSAGAAAAWSPWGGGGAYANTSQSHVATVESSVDDTSTARAEVKAQLTGEVQLRFKSETFPLEKMVDTGGMAMLQARGQPAPLPGQPAAAPAPTPGAPR